MKYTHRRQALMVAMLISVFLSGWPINRAVAQDEKQPATTGDQAVSPEDELVARSRALSTSTTQDGKGWEEYQTFLHEDFSRWSRDTEVLDREESVAMIQQWWEDGNRQSKSEEEVISVQIVGETGVVRKKIHETYVDAVGNDAGEYHGHVTQTWVKETNSWQLLSVTIQSDP